MMDDRNPHSSPMSDELRQDGDNQMGYDNDRFRRNQGTILFVGNLPFQTPWQHVKDHFRQAGKVRYTDLIADRSGRPKGSALVTMMTPEGADNAIRLFNETDFEGRRLIVRKFDEGPRPPLVHRDMMPPYNNRRGPYMGAAAGAGAVAGNYYGQGMHPAGGFGQGGYEPNGLDDMMMEVGVDGVPKPRSQQVSEVGRKLFVSNLPFDCTNAALRETFNQVGEVERADIILGRNGKSRGMGIVVMKTEEQARIAIAEFDGIEMANRAMNVRLDNKTQQ